MRNDDGVICCRGQGPRQWIAGVDGVRESSFFRSPFLLSLQHLSLQLDCCHCSNSQLDGTSPVRSSMLIQSFILLHGLLNFSFRVLEWIWTLAFIYICSCPFPPSHSKLHEVREVKHEIYVPFGLLIIQ